MWTTRLPINLPFCDLSRTTGTSAGLAIARPTQSPARSTVCSILRPVAEQPRRLCSTRPWVRCKRRNSIGGGTGGSATTTAVAGRRMLLLRVNQFQLDGTKSTSFDGKPLTYQWALISGGLRPRSATEIRRLPSCSSMHGRAHISFVLTVTDSAGNTAIEGTVTIRYVGH